MTARYATPADTIREALTSMRAAAWGREAADLALAALTELEQQLATLREIEDGTTPDRIGQYNALRDWVNKTARAALATPDTPPDAPTEEGP